MPWKDKRPCLHPACRALVNAGERYCPEHKQQYARKVDTSHYDRRWQKLRLLFLQKHPLCEVCREAGQLTPATEVHHIVAVADGGSDREENLQALCKSCHSRKTWEATHG